MPTDTRALTALLAQRLVICVGPGGVGKTTTAAALAIAAALRGRATAVITVDPSRRLQDALGLGALSTEPRSVALGDGAAPLDALALDTKRTFDRLIARVAPSPAVAERILANRLYQELSCELGGSTEYMAMEKLHELLELRRYDLIVVDTPPSGDVRELLAAPGRMTELLASQAVDFLKAPASIITGNESGLMRMTLGAVIKALERWTGMTLLHELSDFVAGFEHLIEGFRARAHAIEQALRAADTSFAIVTTPEPKTVASTLAFDRELRADGFAVAGIIANRTYDFPPLARSAGARVPAALREKLIANYADFAALSARDRAALDALQAQASVPLLAVLPVLEEAPTSLQGLRRIAALLGARTTPRRVPGSAGGSPAA
jgi:anion-transporting  ArsA/GET3 family ATPase